MTKPKRDTGQGVNLCRAVNIIQFYTKPAGGAGGLFFMCSISARHENDSDRKNNLFN